MKKRKCKSCGVEFIAKRKDSFFCSRNCRLKEYYRKSKNRLRDYNKRYRKTDKGIKSHKESNRKYSSSSKKGKQTYKRWVIDNKERRYEINKRWLTNNYGCRKEYYRKNKERLAYNYKEWVKNNKYKRLKTSYRYQKSKKGRMNSKNCNRRYRAAKNNIIEIWTEDEWQNKLKQTNGICPKCNKQVDISKLTLDHIYPVSIANKDYFNSGNKRIYSIKDIQPLCNICNIKKRDKDEERKE